MNDNAERKSIPERLILAFRERSGHSVTALYELGPAGADVHGYRAELLKMVRQAKTINQR